MDSTAPLVQIWNKSQRHNHTVTLTTNCGLVDFSTSCVYCYKCKEISPYCKANSCLCLNPLQSNSWSTPQTSLKYSLDISQRHSDMCAPRQPLSPLYDEPCTPEIYSLEEARPVVSGPMILDPQVQFTPAQPVWYQAVQTPINTWVFGHMITLFLEHVKSSIEV